MAPRVDTEHDNVRRALEWARDRDEGEILLRLTAAVAEYWRVRGLYREARTWLELALERAASPPEARMHVLREAAGRALNDGDLARAAALIAQFRSAAEQAGDDLALMHAMNLSAQLASMRGDLDAAREGFVAVKTLAAELGDRGREAAMAVNLGMVATLSGDFRAGLEHSREAAAGFRELGDLDGTNAALLNCGWSALGLGDPVLAESSFREALAVADRLGAAPRVAKGAEGLGAALVARSDEGRGAELLGAASSLRDELGIGLSDAHEERIHERAVADAKAALGEDAFAAAWARGQALTAKEIVELAVNAGSETA